MCCRRLNGSDAGDDFRDKVVEVIPSMHCYALSLTRNAADADDLAQETLLVAIMHVNSLQSGTNLQARLLTSMRNRFYANIRRSSHELVGLDDCVTVSVAYPPPQDAQMELRDVARALLNLPPPYRATMAFVVLRERPYSLGAEHFCCGIGTIKSRISRARQMMRKALD